MARAGISARCTSSATTCFPSSSAERSLKEVPALTNGVRKPATIATRRPGREAMGTSWECGVVTAVVRRVKKHRPRRRPRPGTLPTQAVSGLLFAQLQQVLPRVDPRRVPIAPLDLHRISPDLVHPLRPDLALDLRLPHHAPPAPLLHALRARASRAQPARRELRVPAVVPADEQVAVGVERQIGGLRLRRLRFDLVEQAHAQGSTASGIHRPCSARRSCSRPSPCPTRCSPGIRSGSGTAPGWRSSCPPERDTSSI